MSILSLDLATASIAELKEAARTIQQARFIAECREHGHDRSDLIPTPNFDADGLPVIGGEPTGITCTRCSAAWTVVPIKST